MASAKDWEAYLRVNAIIESQLGPIVASPDYVDSQRHVEGERADSRVVSYVYVICRCKIIANGCTSNC